VSGARRGLILLPALVCGVVYAASSQGPTGVLAQAVANQQIRSPSLPGIAAGGATVPWLVAIGALLGAAAAFWRAWAARRRLEKAKEDLRTAQTERATAETNLERARTELETARIQLRQAEAALKGSREQQITPELIDRILKRCDCSGRSVCGPVLCLEHCTTPECAAAQLSRLHKVLKKATLSDPP
jgi:multidrug efflux pump subunit AcrA (membrane-fusion protein)